MVWYISGKIAVYDAFTGAEKRHMFFGAFVLCILVNLSIYIYTCSKYRFLHLIFC